jgi:hypothetical protein
MRSIEREVTIWMLVKEDAALEEAAAWFSLREHSEECNLLVQLYRYS